MAKQTIALRTAEANLKNTSAQRARLDARDQQIKQLQDSLNAKQTERGTLVTFGDELFATDKAELKSNGLVNINKLAQYLQENPDRKVIVEGYTDSTGTASHNQSLSETPCQLRAHGPGENGRRSGAYRRPGLRQGIPGGGKQQRVGPSDESSGGSDDFQR
ncbi:outer membrane protein/peptidoglycan-associated (lipo)protein [Pseudomonas sp. GM55]|nr:outer membrane protein/peptidoglycan-associated (lipo)protein [Pseudomonas sp. GM55]